MFQKKAQINVPSKGLNRDSWALGEADYTHLQNGNFDSFDGGTFTLTNEMSNILSSKFKEGFKVIGFKNDINSNNTYFFLVNPETGVGEFGYIKSNQNNNDLEDLTVDCGDCTEIKELATPLEDIVQIELQEYITLLTDDCLEDKTKGFNFSIFHPIKSPIIKDEKCGKTIYFTDNLNPPRYIIIDRIADYFIKDITCEEDEQLDCPDFERMRIFKRFNIPTITPVSIELGGRLKMGVYQFLIAYCDARGNEISEYYSITNPISIFDQNNKILEQPQLADRTNFSIRLEVSGLDKNYTHYKVAVVQTADIDFTDRYFIEGIHTIDDTNVVYTTESGKQVTSLEALNRYNLKVEKVEGMATSNNILFQNGIEFKKEINLQPVVNLMGEFLKAQTHIAPENLYENGVANSLYKGYNRDEVVPFGIKFLLDGGYETSTFPFIARQPDEEDLEYVVETDEEGVIIYDESGEMIPLNQDVASILANKGECNTTDRTRRWQYYNTAKLDPEGSICEVEDVPTVEVVETLNRFCVIEDVATIPTGTLSIEPEQGQEFTGLVDYINDNKGTSEVECDEIFTTSTEDICEYLYADYSTELCEIKSISFSGTGDGVLTIGGVDYNVVFNTDVDTTIADFITVNSADVLLNTGATMQQDGDKIIFLNFYPVISYVGDMITSTYSVFPDECSSISVGQENIEVNTVENEVITYIEKDFASEYFKVVPPESCFLYEIIPNTGNPERDGDAESFTTLSTIYKRDSDFINQECAYSAAIVKLTNPSNNIGQGYFNNYYYNLLEANLLGTKDSTITSANFNTKLHKNALWFKGQTEGKEKFIVDIAKRKIPQKKDSFDSLTQDVRVSIFKSCSASTAIYSDIFSLDSGQTILFEKSGVDLIVTDESGIQSTIVGGWFSNQSYFIVIDTALTKISVDIDPDPINVVLEDRYYLHPTSGCYTVTSRDIEYKRIDISWDSITLKKTVELTSDCTFEQPILQNCKALPYRKYDFAYWESDQTYPDNNELFNSSTLKIKPSDIDLSFRSVFETKFTDGLDVDGNYIWKQDSQKEVVDYTCRNIRHFRFPDNRVAPFMYDLVKPGFSSTIIFPIGVTINEEIINNFLDIAESNGLLTQEDRQAITGYEIVRGDLTTNRSISASGLLFDMRKYLEKEGGKTLLYSNYPFNTLGEDKMNLPFSGETRTDLGEGAEFGVSNRNFTFHSPETDYYKPLISSELSFQSYMFGQSKTFIDEVQSHAKWVILTSKARNLASTLATLEVTTETAIIIASYAEIYRFGFRAGTSSGTDINPIGIGMAITASALAAANNIITKYGRYRYEWLSIFRNLGSPYNFAYYSFAEGNYNYLQNGQSEGNLLRGINVGKYLTDDRFSFTNETTGERGEINNLYRENSVFLSTGKFPIEYENSNYLNHDNGLSSSLTYAGENGIKQTGRTPEILKNIASPYVALKNYLPSQHGTINSIAWLTTGFRGDLKNPTISCNSIFGGDTVISRHTLKRKHAQFLTAELNRQDLTPYNYFFYNNIGRNPRFYVSYEQDKDFEGNGKLFPDIDSDFIFDNDTKGGNYYRPPSKFYLYYYGIPSFLCETRINTNYRYAGNEKSEQFYPQVGDIGEWTQEKNVPIRTPNSFRYNSTYSKDVDRHKNRVIPTDYNKEFYDCKDNSPNGVIYSLPDVTENSLFDPWLIYRPLDFYEFPKTYGKLKELRGVESAQVLARFENTVAIFNAVDTIVDDGSRPEAPFLGDGGVFARRPVTFSETDLGYGGTQTSLSVSCEFGHFHVDAKRGQVVQILPGGKGIEEISSIINGKPSGMRNWFKEHLPFKILKSNMEGVNSIDTDNAYNGVGIVLGWDSRFRRIFITKKDYIPKSSCISHEDGKFYYNCGEIEEVCAGNLVTNGTFDTDLNGWNFVSNWQQADGRAVYSGIDENEFTIFPPLRVSQDILEAGKTYRVSINVNLEAHTLGQGSREHYYRVYAGTNFHQIDGDFGSGTYTFDILSDGTTLSIEANDTDNPCSFEGEGCEGFPLSIDNVTVCEVINEQTKFEVDLTDPTYFEDVSWTIAYSPIQGAWMSFYDYKPNYYINHNNYFQTGVNQTNDGNEFGLWAHLLTNKSYQVFYGKKYPFIVEYTLKRTPNNMFLNSISFKLDVLRYHNQYDFAEVGGKAFDKLWISSQNTHSGELRLVENTGQLSLISKYPKTATDGSYQEILYSKFHNDYSINYFYNRVVKKIANVPLWIWDKNQINKEVSLASVKFSGKNVLEPIRTTVPSIRLQQDKESRFRYNFNLGISKFEEEV
jgi:hypothetical protein